MKIKPILACALLVSILLAGCSGASSPLKELAETYAEIADNNQELAEAFQAVYQAPRDSQESAMEKAQATAERVKGKNEQLIEKAVVLGEKLQGESIECVAGDELGIQIKAASFSDVNALTAMANIVITVEVEGTPATAVDFCLVDGDKTIYRAPARYSDGKIYVNFHINATNAREIASAKSIILKAREGGMTSATGETIVEESSYIGKDNSRDLNEATPDGVKIEKGANLVAVLKAAKSVTYEYNADSGIWAHIGNVSIIIDEDQLNKKGIEFINSIPSDIEPNLAFSPEYIKPDAKILNIEED